MPRETFPVVLPRCRGRGAAPDGAGNGNAPPATYLARHKLRLNVLLNREPSVLKIVFVKLRLSAKDKSLTLAYTDIS